jgi:1-acyl-sn-glycerol-3-phosphate acyltransferase
MRFLRSTIFNLCFYVLTPIAGLLLAPATLGPRRWACRIRDTWIDAELWVLRHVVGLVPQVDGLEHMPDGPVLIACKHQSAWETIFLHQQFRDPTIVLKQEIRRLPIFGWYISKVGMVPVDRAAGAAAMRTMLEAARDRIAEGRRIIIFPQGTRVPPGGTLKYHPGVFALYRALGVPVVPMALNSGLFWPKHAYLHRPGTVRLQVLEPIPPGLDRATFMNTLETRIETATTALEADARLA